MIYKKKFWYEEESIEEKQDWSKRLMRSAFAELIVLIIFVIIYIVTYIFFGIAELRVVCFEFLFIFCYLFNLFF